MTPEQIEAQQDIAARLEAIRLADKRVGLGSSTEDVIAEAEKVLKFLKAGIKVAS